MYQETGREVDLLIGVQNARLFPLVAYLEHHRVGNVRLLQSDFGTGMLLDGVHSTLGTSELYHTQEAYKMCHTTFGSIKFEDIHESPVTRPPVEKTYEEEGCKDTKEGSFKLPDTKNETSKVAAEDPGAEDPAEHPAARVSVEVPAGSAKTTIKASGAVGERL